MLVGPRNIGTTNPIPAQAGIGLRFQHHQAVLDARPEVGWMEVHTENYMGGGTPIRYLEAIRRDTPISLHGVGLSLGSAEGIDAAHLERIRKVAERIEPGLMSEHIAWNIAGGEYLADLLPLPLTEEALDVVCRHVDQTQTYLKRRILVENPSTYVAFGNSIIPEWEFMAAVAARTGCGILCDVNNICVSATITAGTHQPTLQRCQSMLSGKSISPVTVFEPLPTAVHSGLTTTGPGSARRSGRFTGRPSHDSARSLR